MTRAKGTTEANFGQKNHKKLLIYLDDGLIVG